MNKLVLTIATVFITMSSIAQNNQNKITISASSSFTIAPVYSSKMIVSLNNVYYDAQTMTLDEVKSGYLAKLAKVGFTGNQLVEDHLQYALIGYEKEGTVLVFKTKSLAEMQKFLNVKALGVTRSETNLEAELSDDEMASYAKSAFDKAKSQATKMADKIGRKIGKAIHISDSNSKKIKQSLYNSADANSRDYHISVSFELL